MSNLPYPFDRRWEVDDAVQLACTLEATAPKAGNVHPFASFDDMSFSHFAASAITLRPIFDDLENRSVGQLVLDAVRSTKENVGVNTNLGTILLLAPLAKALLDFEQEPQIAEVLSNLGAEDSSMVYQAIRLAQPGGLGDVDSNDVASEAPEDLVEAMRQAAHRDSVARQYATNFVDIFGSQVHWLLDALEQSSDVLDSICLLQLRILAHESDSLIARKVGSAIAQETQRLAKLALDSYEEERPIRLSDFPAYQKLDAFLRADGNRRNPGTTADLIAATLFVCLVGYRPS